MGCSKLNLSLKNNSTVSGKCLGLKNGIPYYQTCGLKNPYYKENDYYYSKALGRTLNRCLLENYWTNYLYGGISANPNENLRTYYDSIVLYIKSMYLYLKHQYGLKYSNLSTECSVILLIKRCLSNIVSEEEMSKLILLLKLKSTCDCLD